LENSSALARFIARVGFVDDIGAAFAANDLAISVALFQRLKGIRNLHCPDPSIGGRKIGIVRVRVKQIARSKPQNPSAILNRLLTQRE